MANELRDRKVAILAADGVEQVELEQPRQAVRDAGARLVNSGKPVAAICHGPWTLVEADGVRGRRITSYPSIRTDLRNAGAEVADEEVVTDANITSSRNPDDLPAFCDSIVREFSAVHA